MSKYNLNYLFDEELHEVPENPSDMELYIHDRKTALATIQNPIERVKTLGEIGVYLRILCSLGEAADYLLKALEIIDRHNLDFTLTVTMKIRLAHVYQWQKRFDLSNPMFDELLGLAKSQDLGTVNDFIWQHAGKNYFDQMKWADARVAFERALKIRVARGAPPDQIQSSQQSIQACLQRMN